ncbi:lectin C-type domain-containing protein [Rutstroemia sp. NJR-2017a BBW]|nr:lectin C-type domain-containing protein [Rutstroemia sp. NJR-2017a BBW]
MSENYAPNPDAYPASPYDTAFLSQRDLGLKVPINFVTAPGVSLTAACFPFLRYEDDNSADCLSNLLASGFRRLEVDLYWDQMRQVWSFCPVGIPASVSPAVLSATPTTTSSLSSSTVALTSAEATTNLRVRQETSETVSSSSLSSGSSTKISSISSSSDSSSTTSASATSLGSVLPKISVIPDSPNAPLYSIGEYTCTTTINLSTLISQLVDYLQKTQNTLAAHLLSITLNIHAVKSVSNINGPAPEPTDLPSSLDTLGALFSANLSAYMYTPDNLRTDRTNLNASWYSVSQKYWPVQDYYTTTTNQYGIVSTEDGWPSESYIEFSRSKRLLLQFGSVDPQMTSYNFSADASTIFPHNYMSTDQSSSISSTPTGNLTSGCFLNTSSTSLSLSTSNSSWATLSTLPQFPYPTTPPSNLTSLLNLTSALTACGISSTLNHTLLNTTARTNPLPYQSFSYATIWSWAPNEPRNDTSAPDDTESSLFRCAAMDSELGGRWVVADCSDKLYAACRAPGDPYNWTLSTYPTSYSYASSACPSPYTFSVPRTALENSYLALLLSSASSSSSSSSSSQLTPRTSPFSPRDDDDPPTRLFIDLSSLSLPQCWVPGGPNATCPYSSLSDNDAALIRRQVLVPTIAAIIVLVCGKEGEGTET